jgi:hypothetical protein
MKTIGMARWGIGLEAARHLEAVHARHHRVQQHDVRPRLGRTLQGRWGRPVATSTV